MSARGADRMLASAVRMDASKEKKEASEFECRVCCVHDFVHFGYLHEALLYSGFNVKDENMLDLQEDI